MRRWRKDRARGAEAAGWMEPWRSGSFEVTGGGKDIRGKTEDKHKASKVGC